MKLNFNFQKFLGWGLLIFGLIIIGWSLIFAFNIFTGKKIPPQIFKIKDFETKKFEKISQIKPLKENQKILTISLLKEIFPKKAFAKMLNLLSVSILIFILIFGASQIASLGIKILINKK